MRILLAAAVAVTLVPTAMAADTFTIEPGKYKTTMTMSMSMMPNGMTNTSEHCVTPEEASKTPADLMEEMSQGGGSCDVSDVTSKSGAMAFNFTCTGGDMGDMSGRYDLAYKNNSYTFKGTMQGNMQGMDVNMKMDGNAVRIGAC